MTRSLFLSGILLICGCLGLGAQEPVTDELDGREIREIAIKTKRVSPNYIRKILPIQEGGKFSAADLEKTRQRLYRLRFFKKVDVRAANAGDGVKVELDLEDGWFIFPLPFYSGGGGGSSASLMVVERNLFRRAETIFAFGGATRESRFAQLGFQHEENFISGFLTAREFTEWNYVDGGFNAVSRVRSSSDEDHPERYGSIDNRYRRSAQGGGVTLRRTLNKNFGVSLGGSIFDYRYFEPTTPVLPNDRGRAVRLQQSVDWKIFNSEDARAGGSSFSFGDFGAVFGFGMADAAERIKPLAHVVRRLDTEVSIAESDRALGSDFNFVTVSAGIMPSIVLKNHQRIAARVKGTTSLRENLPLSQKAATNRKLGMRGNYSREFRGDRGAGGALNFIYPFRKTKRGVWTGEVFGDWATVWNAGISRSKEGFGAGLSYQFWRFPLPIGVLYSYSVDDRESQINFAFGGRF